MYCISLISWKECESFDGMQKGSMGVMTISIRVCEWAKFTNVTLTL